MYSVWVWSMLFLSDGIEMNKTLAASHSKLAADQGHADAEFNFAESLLWGDGVEMNTSQATHNYKFSAHQGDTMTQFQYQSLLVSGKGGPMNKSLLAQYWSHIMPWCR
jgi:TPR repeat protein